MAMMMNSNHHALFSPACEGGIKNQHQKSKKRSNLDQMGEDRPPKKIRIKFNNESFLCSRPPIKQIQDVKRLIMPGKNVAPKPKVSCTKKRGVLGSLIQHNIVESGSKVSYLSKKDGSVMKKGRVFEDGIKCDCCHKMFLLTKFEAHAGSTNHRPAANLFFDDKRSILDCQTQLQLETVLPSDDKSTKSVITDVESTISSPCVTTTNDEYCSFSCDSKVHDLKKCAQCEHHFRLSCIKKLGYVQECPNDAKWFCKLSCERIYKGLMKIRGNVIPLKGEKLTWSLLKCDENDTDVYEYVKSYSKLMEASNVMQECFAPVEHPLLDKDLIEDVIFSNGTKRSNIEGFYTAVLEKHDEIITVVALRIHGYKVAEIPFVATTLKYRGKGMCLILMNEVERMMRGLGVERIVLPASPEKVSNWTRSFGFREMTDIERRDLVEYKFLEFEGTKRCVKKLKQM